MTHISALSSPTRTALRDQNVIVFDGVCVLCSGFFKFVVRVDQAQQFRFVTAQSPLGQAIYRDLGLPTEDFETNLVIVGGEIHQRLDAFCAAMRALGWPWRALAAASWLPRRIKDPLYYAIARNRYKVFGRTDTCMIPTPSVRARFLDLPS
jgi:predicted DCC family thiol-disulfide oxidoreductase YuxK